MRQEYRFVLLCLGFYLFSSNRCGPKSFLFFSLSLFLSLFLLYSFSFPLFGQSYTRICFLHVSMGSYCAKSIGLFCFVWDFTFSLSINAGLRVFFSLFFVFLPLPPLFLFFFSFFGQSYTRICFPRVSMGSYCAKSIGLFCSVWDFTSSHSIKVDLRVLLFLSFLLSFFLLFFSFRPILYPYLLSSCEYGKLLRQE